MKSPSWWKPSWKPGTPEDPDTGWGVPNLANDDATDNGIEPGDGWRFGTGRAHVDDAAILAPLEAEFGQVRSRERVRDLAEVFTHQREIDEMLNMVPDAFTAIDIKFLEPAAGSGNFLVEILRRKLRLVSKADCVSQAQYEHRLLRAAAAIYGIDISVQNVTEARGRMAHVLLEHYALDANTVEPTPGFLHAAALILGSNIVHGDTLNFPERVELCDWRPSSGGRFQRVWSYALIPETSRDLFWSERVQDREPVHYADLTGTAARDPKKATAQKRATALPKGATRRARVAP